MKSGEKDKNYSWKECSCYFYRIEHMFGGCKECTGHKTHAAGKWEVGPTVITKSVVKVERNGILYFISH